MSMRQIFLLPLLLSIKLCYAGINFPELTGRIVDNANLINTAEENSLTQLLASHENATTNQIVVVTLQSLQGYTIEEFGYQLGRHWQIGQSETNNGVLLIVAKSERKVRIEVGYGLEGLLTDAVSSNIINTVIVPEFKKAQFSQGIVTGTQAVIQALGGEYTPNNVGQADDDSSPLFFFWLIVFIIIIISLSKGSSGHSSYNRSNSWGNDHFGGSGGFGGGGGFSGGGGSFGGGGASGGW